MSKNLPMINEALTVARLYWGYSQTELAEKLGVSQAMVSEIERGQKAVSMEMLERYSKALGVRMSQLLFFAEEIEGVDQVRRGRFVVAEKVLRLLKKLKPNDDSCQQPT
jgi:transcriptional regulator with XRE-family HTH domain